MWFLLQEDEEEVELDISMVMLIVVFMLAFVTPWIFYVYVECFTEKGRQLRKKQLAEKKARKESKKLRKESKKLSVEIGRGK